MGSWTLPQVNLDKNPLNATLVLLNEKGLKQDVFKIDLYTPKYDREANRLHYDFTLLGNTNSMPLPEKFGTAVLLISGVSLDISEKCDFEASWQDPKVFDSNLSQCYLVEHQKVACPA